MFGYNPIAALSFCFLLLPSSCIHLHSSHLFFAFFMRAPAVVRRHKSRPREIDASLRAVKIDISRHRPGNPMTLLRRSTVRRSPCFLCQTPWSFATANGKHGRAKRALERAEGMRCLVFQQRLLSEPLTRMPIQSGVFVLRKEGAYQASCFLLIVTTTVWISQFGNSHCYCYCYWYRYCYCYCYCNAAQIPQKKKRKRKRKRKMIKASSRAAISRSIFSSTFLVAFSLVLANSIVPCPVDRSVANDSKMSPTQMQELMEKKSK